jgi:hypothetical protein
MNGGLELLSSVFEALELIEACAGGGEENGFSGVGDGRRAFNRFCKVPDALGFNCFSQGRLKYVRGFADQERTANATLRTFSKRC